MVPETDNEVLMREFYAQQELPWEERDVHSADKATRDAARLRNAAALRIQNEGKHRAEQLAGQGIDTAGNRAPFLPGSNPLLAPLPPGGAGMIVQPWERVRANEVATAKALNAAQQLEAQRVLEAAKTAKAAKKAAKRVAKQHPDKIAEAENAPRGMKPKGRFKRNAALALGSAMAGALGYDAYKAEPYNDPLM